jgi:hypothetical protein
MKYPESSGVLRRLDQQEALLIGPCDGTETFAATRAVSIYSKVDIVRFASVTEPTTLSSVAMFEPTIEASLPQMFTSLSMDLNALCFTEHQIILFCRTHLKLLRKSYPTFLLFRVGRLFFVAWAFDYEHTPVVTVHDFYVNHALPADPYRLVVPEFAL